MELIVDIGSPSSIVTNWHNSNTESCNAMFLFLSNQHKQGYPHDGLFVGLHLEYANLVVNVSFELGFVLVYNFCSTIVCHLHIQMNIKKSFI